MTEYFFENNIKFLFILVLVLGIILRTQYLDKSLQKDETPFVEATKNLCIKNIPLHSEKYLFDGAELAKSLCRSPLFLFYLSGVVRIFDLNEVALRLSMVVPSILTIILMYFVGTMVGGKKLGLLSSFLLAISRLHVEHAQIIDTDGSILTFLTLLTIFFLLKSWMSKKNRYIILSSITIAASFLVKEPILLILPPLFLYYFQKRNLPDFFVIFTSFMLISLVSLLIFSYFYSTDFLSCFIRWVNGFVFRRTANLEYYQYRLYQFIGISSWDLTLPFIILFIFSIFHAIKTRKEINRFFVLFSLLFLAFCASIMGITKYFVPIIPVMSLLIADFILDSKILVKKNIFFILILAFSCFILFYLLKIRTDVLFLNDLKNNLYLIATPFILPLIPLILYFSNNKRLAIVVLFGMFIGFNIYFAQEAVNPLVSPDYGKANIEAANFIISNSIQGPIVTDQDIAFYSNSSFYYILAPFMSVQYIQNLINKYSVVYVIYKTNVVTIQPTIENFLDTNCQKIGSSISRNVEIFKAYRCVQD